MGPLSLEVPSRTTADLTQLLTTANEASQPAPSLFRDHFRSDPNTSGPNTSGQNHSDQFRDTSGSRDDARWDQVQRLSAASPAPGSESEVRDRDGDERRDEESVVTSAGVTAPAPPPEEASPQDVAEGESRGGAGEGPLSNDRDAAPRSDESADESPASTNRPAGKSARPRRGLTGAAAGSARQVVAGDETDPGAPSLEHADHPAQRAESGDESPEALPSMLDAPGASAGEPGVTAKAGQVASEDEALLSDPAATLSMGETDPDSGKDESKSAAAGPANAARSRARRSEAANDAENSPAGAPQRAPAAIDAVAATFGTSDAPPEAGMAGDDRERRGKSESRLVGASGAGDPPSNMAAAMKTDDQTPTTQTRFAQQLAARSDHPAARGMRGNEVDQGRFVDRVARAFEAAQNRRGLVKLRLHPPELGSLHIELRVQNGGLTARLEAETSAAQALLIEHAQALRDRLSDQGVRIDRFDVDLLDRRSQDNPGAFSESSDSDGGWRGERRGLHAARREAEVITAPRGLPVAGQLNVIV